MKIISADADSRLPSNFKLHLEHGRSNYLFVLFKSPAMLFIDDKYIFVDNGAGIFFDKNKIQSYYACNDKEFNHDFVLFDLENDYEKLIFSEISMGKPFSFVIPATISEAIYAIKNEFINYSAYRDKILSNAGMIFIYKVINELSLSYDNKFKNNYKVLHNLKTEIYRYPGDKWYIGKMCEKTCLSRYYLQHLYKNLFGVTCMTDVIRARIEASKILLLNSNYRISEIAEKCGYNNAEHFIRQFKKITGITPNNFRDN